MSRKPDEEKRKRVFDIVFQSVYVVGYKATNLTSVTDSVRCTHGSIYTYFDYKEIPFIAVTAEMWQVFINVLGHLIQRGKDFVAWISSDNDLNSCLIFAAHDSLNIGFASEIQEEASRKNLGPVARIFEELFLDHPGSSVFPSRERWKDVSFGILTGTSV